jgi:hypothetical protein
MGSSGSLVGLKQLDVSFAGHVDRFAENPGCLLWRMESHRILRIGEIHAPLGLALLLAGGLERGIVQTCSLCGRRCINEIDHSVFGLIQQFVVAVLDVCDSRLELIFRVVKIVSAGARQDPHYDCKKQLQFR